MGFQCRWLRWVRLDLVSVPWALSIVNNKKKIEQNFVHNEHALTGLLKGTACHCGEWICSNDWIYYLNIISTTWYSKKTVRIENGSILVKRIVNVLLLNRFTFYIRNLLFLITVMIDNSAYYQEYLLLLLFQDAEYLAF